MSHVFQIDDDTYEMLNAIASQQQKRPEELFEEWVAEVRIHDLANRTFDETNFERDALGMSDDMIAAAEQLRHELYGDDDADSYGATKREGELHIIWRRIGGHEIYVDP